MTTEPAVDVAGKEQRVIEIDTIAQLIAFASDGDWPLMRDDPGLAYIRRAAERVYEHGFRLAQPAFDLDALRGLMSGNRDRPPEYMPANKTALLLVVGACYTIEPMAPELGAAIEVLRNDISNHGRGFSRNG